MYLIYNTTAFFEFIQMFLRILLFFVFSKQTKLINEKYSQTFTQGPPLGKATFCLLVKDEIISIMVSNYKWFLAHLAWVYIFCFDVPFSCLGFLMNFDKIEKTLLSSRHPYFDAYAFFCCITITMQTM